MLLDSHHHNNVIKFYLRQCRFESSFVLLVYLKGDLISNISLHHCIGLYVPFSLTPCLPLFYISFYVNP